MSKITQLLDYKIVDARDRTMHVRQVLDELQASGYNISTSDCDDLTNYLCCGTLVGESKSPVQRKEVQLEGDKAERARARTRATREDSLDALLESPTFNEGTQFAKQGIVYRKPKPSFQRDAVPEDALPLFEPLWQQIDEWDEKLTNNVLPAAQAALARKHLLELRRTQYTLMDGVKPQLQRHDQLQGVWRGGEAEAGIAWETGYVGVLPLGLYSECTRFTAPWLPATYTPTPSRLYVDFRKVEHLAALVRALEELEEEATTNCESAIPQLARTLQYYAEQADLTDEQREILALKVNRASSAHIARHCNEKYGTNHTDSYISTILTQRIYPAIARAAELHEATFAARGIPSKFKRCPDCGRTLLLDERLWTRYSRTHDGFQCRCKLCEREKRKLRAERKHTKEDKHE